MPLVADFSDRNRWICATDARRTWRLNDDELEALNYVQTANPRGAHLPPMRLFAKEQLMAASYAKWGGAEGLRAHNERVARANVTRAANRAAGRGGGRSRGVAPPGVARGGVRRGGRGGRLNPAAGRATYWAAAGQGQRLGSSSEVWGDPAYELDASWDEPYDYDPNQYDNE